MRSIHAVAPRPPVCRLGVAFVITLMVSGCGGDNLAEVAGKVTHNGEPIKGGTLLFSLAGADTRGRVATAAVQPDGSYLLMTGDSEGALIGTHTVNFTPPEQDLTEEQRTDPKYIAPPPLYLYLVPKESQVEIKAGENTVDIELVSQRNGGR
jgi:hypothetical protein